MKKLDVRLVVKANDIHEAEAITQRELMGLVKLIGMKSGSSIGSCRGDVTLSLGCHTYQAAALVEIDGNGDVNGAIAGVQNEWNMKPEILSSSIFVTEEKHEEVTPKPATVVCENCGQILMKGSENIINPETTNEYYLCDDCLEVALDNDVVVCCDCCETYVSEDDLVKNPVTGSDDLCPYCGNKID